MRSVNFVVLAITILCLSLFTARGQGCRVMLKPISGTYTGDCNKGKAEGNGKAEGSDQYTGMFKAGLPDGKGTYHWANGDSYEGLWAKGLRSGKGLLTKKDGSFTDGYWEKDVYIGIYEKPYIVYQTGTSISKSEIKKDSDKEQSVQFNISNTSGGGMSLQGGTFPKPELSEILVLKGSYAQLTDGLETQSSIKKKLLNVSFPFRAKITTDGQVFDFEILNPGQWVITLEVQANLVQGGVKN